MQSHAIARFGRGVLRRGREPVAFLFEAIAWQRDRPHGGSLIEQVHGERVTCQIGAGNTDEAVAAPANLE